MEETLPTINVPGVEVFMTGTHHGKKYSVEDLDNIVASFHAMPHFTRPVTLGHDATVSGSGSPAVGWVENLRREGETLIGDLMKVPQKLGLLFQSGAYRTRSCELLRNFTDTVTETTYPLVFKSLALLGAVMPEVKTLEDIVELYAGDAEVEIVRFEAPFEISDAGSYEYLRGQIESSLPNGGWVRRMYPTFVIVSRWDGDNDVLELYPYAVGPDGVEIGTPTPVVETTNFLVQFDALDELTVCIKEVLNNEDIEAKRTAFQFIEDRFNALLPQPSTQPMKEGEHVMPEIKEALAQVLKMSADASDDEVVQAVIKLSAQPDTKDVIEAFRASPEFQTLLADTQAAKKELFEMKRDNLIDQAVRDGRILPAKIEFWREQFAANEAMATAIIGNLEPVIEFQEKGDSHTETPSLDSFDAKVMAKVEELRSEHSDWDAEQLYDAAMDAVGEVKE